MPVQIPKVRPRPRVQGNLSYLRELGVPVQIPMVRPRPREQGNLSHLGELGAPVQIPKVRPRPRVRGILSHLGELSSTFEKKHYEKLCIMFHYKLASFLTNFRKLPPLNFF